MALLAEEIVEEWLRRQGYFTIRGIKLGIQEIDLLAVRSRAGQSVECRHIEVQASVRPISYISKIPKNTQQNEGRSANSVKRSEDELCAGVVEWVEKKFKRSDKVSLRKSLWDETWSNELVINKVKSEEEVKLIANQGITILRLADIVKFLGYKHDPAMPIVCASGGDLVELLNLTN
jgi:hypothetical protein